MKKHVWVFLLVANLAFLFISNNAFAQYIFTSFDYPGATNSQTQAYGINDSGQIVGRYDGGAEGYRGFIKDGATFTSFAYPGTASFTSATSINNSGQTVGYYDDSSGMMVYSFIKDGATFTSFDFPGTYGSTYAWDINNKGQIVGYYFDENFAQHSFLATPIHTPEPTTMLLLGLGLVGVVGVKRKFKK